MKRSVKRRTSCEDGADASTWQCVIIRALAHGRFPGGELGQRRPSCWIGVQHPGFCQHASKAAREARDAAFRRSLSEEMSGANRVLRIDDKIDQVLGQLSKL
jgi:hypothetical protein